MNQLNSPKRQTAWTREELRNLKAVNEGKYSMHSQMHLFPGRSYSAVNNKIIRMYGHREHLPHYLRWGYLDKVESFLKESPGSTLVEISKGAGVNVAYLRRLMMSDDRPFGFYISGWANRSSNLTRYSALFSFDEDRDSADDVPPPARITKTSRETSNI